MLIRPGVKTMNIRRPIKYMVAVALSMNTKRAKANCWRSSILFVGDRTLIMSLLRGDEPVYLIYSNTSYKKES